MNLPQRLSWQILLEDLVNFERSNLWLYDIATNNGELHLWPLVRTAVFSRFRSRWLTQILDSLLLRDAALKFEKRITGRARRGWIGGYNAIGNARMEYCV